MSSEYGSCIFGFKNDRLVELLSPISMRKFERKKDADQGMHDFLEHIMQYWILSVKDPKWSGEKERRYVLFLYDEYDYIELDFDDTFLKMQTSIFLLPDFILGDRPTKMSIQYQVNAARKALSIKSYFFVMRV